ncbi:hypothetical protein [Bifidobacterium xylocopae]|uniref:hypothetical protein n=1 Tax=Bifidobacterium xylocopae TaxID=2493119 RepID=UPI000FDE405A|nr:hypothetical protein [Bifidobacterium xylocopae]
MRTSIGAADSGTNNRAKLKPKRIDLYDLDTVVKQVVDNPEWYRSLPHRVKANRMAIKMARGGCNDNGIERADALRLKFNDWKRTHYSLPDYSDDLFVVSDLLQEAADELTDQAQNSTDPNQTWGAVFWKLLGEKCKELASAPEARGFDKRQLLGLASELAEECKIWFSPSFDADQELRRLQDTIRAKEGR